MLKHARSSIVYLILASPGGPTVSNILDFMTPGKAMFKYVP